MNADAALFAAPCKAPVGSRLVQYLQNSAAPPPPFGLAGGSPSPTFPRVPHSASSPLFGLAPPPPPPPPPPDVRLRAPVCKSPVVGQPPPFAAAAAASSSFVQESVGGTTYFFTPVAPADGNGRPGSSQLNEPDYIVAPQFRAFATTSAVDASSSSNRLSYFTSDEIRQELVRRQLLTLAQCGADAAAELPAAVESYEQLVPLEAPHKSDIVQRNSFFMAHVSSAYKALNNADGLYYCLRRVHNCRLPNPRSLEVLHSWTKVNHANVVQLRSAFTTQQFGDHSAVFVYDYHAGCETLQSRHFGGLARLNGVVEPGAPYAADAKAAATGCPEALIWGYVVQLSSALRAIHAANLAARTINPSKVVLIGRTKLMVNCSGILDALTFEATNGNLPAVLQQYQQEDLIGLGRIVLALACGSLQASSRENLPNSMMHVTQHYSQDLRNLITYLLMASRRSINDIMPMIGARFYAQLEMAQRRCDQVEVELSKELENGRLFRLVCKLGMINERPEQGLDANWSETGDRYLLKLFRDYLFHQTADDGRSWVDMAHVVLCLNKLDAGTAERVALVSRDEQNALVVSYADLRRCVDGAFAELLRAADPPL